MIGIERSNQRTKRATRNVKAGLSMMTSAWGRLVSTARTTRAIWLTIRGSRPGMAENPMIAKSSIGNRLTRPAAAISRPPTPENHSGSLEHCRSARSSAAPSRSPDSSAATRKISNSPDVVRTPGRLDLHRSVPSALTPMTKTLARSAVAAMRSGSATSVEPATTAKPAKPAPAAASTVGGPITGRSMRWS